MKISRRALFGLALGAAGATAVGAVAFAGPGVKPAAPTRHGDAYQPGPGDPRRHGPGDMIMQMLNSKWHTHLLPFAANFSSKTAVLAELKRARALRLFK
jgi:hypothetical protein